MAHRDVTFERTAGAALAALGGDPDGAALDGWTDPTEAAELLGKLGEKGTLLLRAAGELGAAEPGFTPAPAIPSWVQVTRGSAEIRLCPALGSGAEACETRRVTRVVVDTEPRPDSDSGSVARVSLTLDRKASAQGSSLLVAEAWASTEELAVARVGSMAARLARALSVPASLPGSSTPKSEAGGPSAEATPLPARALARYALRAEGPRLVLRDFASRGPREGAGLHLFVGLVFAAACAGAWSMFARSAGAAGATSALALAWLGGSVLLTLAAVAFLGVARFARGYKATSAPLVAFGGGKVVVGPWVSRNGAVGLDLEGRFGAGIDLAEVQGISVRDRPGGHAVELATDHGPFDALVTPDARIAARIADALARVLDDLRPKGAGPTARQRARTRAVYNGARG